MLTHRTHTHTCIYVCIRSHTLQTRAHLSSCGAHTPPPRPDSILKAGSRVTSHLVSLLSRFLVILCESGDQRYDIVCVCMRYSIRKMVTQEFYPKMFSLLLHVDPGRGLLCRVCIYINCPYPGVKKGGKKRYGPTDFWKTCALYMHKNSHVHCTHDHRPGPPNIQINLMYSIMSSVCACIILV